MKQVILSRAGAVACILFVTAPGYCQTGAPGNPSSAPQTTSGSAPDGVHAGSDSPVSSSPTISSPPAVPAPDTSPAAKKGHTKPKVTGTMVMSVPYRPWKGLITVDGLANGNNPARFIVATGLNISTVTPEDAVRLQMTTSHDTAHVAVLDASVDAVTATISSLRLGAGIIHDVKMAQVNTISLLTHEHNPGAPTCWLGGNWLSGYQVTLDFASHTLVLASRDAPFEKEDGIIIPFKLKDGRPVVRVNVRGGGSFPAIVDTSSVGTLIPSEIALKLKSKRKEKKPSAGLEYAAGQIGRMELPLISVGKAELKNQIVAYYGPAAPAGTDKTLAVIGLDFLRRFKVTISYAKSKMMLVPPITTVNERPETPNPNSGKRPGSYPGQTTTQPNTGFPPVFNPAGSTGVPATVPH